MESRAKIEIVPDTESLARRSLALFTEAAQKAVTVNGAFYTAISGGHTPKGFFELLGQSNESKKLDWSEVRLFWVDERYVSPDSELSNFKLACDTFLGRVPIPPGNVYRIFTEYRDMNKSAKEYEQTIRSVFNLKRDEIPKFDMIFLGLGPDGHIASLFPGNQAVLETKKLVTAVMDAKVKPDRITLTAPVLCAAASLVILVSGKEKAEILKQVLNSEPDVKKYPVHILWPVLDKVTWLVDSAAAGQ